LYEAILSASYMLDVGALAAGMSCHCDMALTEASAVTQGGICSTE
jgi:hypothetical protein